MGLAFLLDAPAINEIADPPRALVIEVSGRFDLEYAYIPNFEDQCSTLVKKARAQPNQHVADAFIRHTVSFEAARFEIPCKGIVGVRSYSPTVDSLESALEAHFAKISSDERAYRQLKRRPRGTGFTSTLRWSPSAIVDQHTFNAAVHDNLFEPGTEPLRYALQLMCRVRRSPAHLFRGYNSHSTRSADLEKHSAEDASAEIYLVELFLSNATTRESAAAFGLYQHRIMDVGFTARIFSGQHRKMRFHLDPEDYRYQSRQEVDGFGVTCSLISNPDGTLATESLPIYEQPLMEAPTAAEAGMREAPDFERLAQDPLPILDDFIRVKRAHAETWSRRISELEARGSPELEFAREDLSQFVDEVARASYGVELLRSRPALLRAFCFMNDAMHQATQIQGKPFRQWRLFQLGFILSELSQIPRGLTASREYRRPIATPPSARRSSSSARAPLKAAPADDEAAVAVLGVPPGEGKTEAYFALITIAMFWQRMAGRLYGTTVLVSFTLRMLSTQQFERFAYVVGAAERVRVREKLPGFAFTLGYFTGKDTPNQVSSREPYAIKTYLPYLIRTPGWQEKVRFISHCPHCKSEVRIEADLESFTIKHVCSNASCFSNQPPPKGEAHLHFRGHLGIFVTDCKIYHVRPTVVIGTLDKTVVAGHNSNFRYLYGAARWWCPVHGASLTRTCRYPTIRDGCDEDQPVECGNNPENPSGRTIRLPRMLDPGIPIRVIDELHLLSEDLGNYSSHYESLLETIQCSYPDGRPPLVLGATATSNDLEHHVRHLFLRRARRFPAQGADLDTSFYTRVCRDPDTGEPLVRRCFLGALPVNTQPGRVAEWACDVAQHYQDLHSESESRLRTQPVAACASWGLDSSRAEEVQLYFNSMLVTNLIYVLKVSDAIQVAERLKADNTRFAQEDRPPRPFERLDGESTISDIQRVIGRIEGRHEPRPRMVVATSVVSHGVDVEQINLAVIVGRPVRTTEYIQTTSRCARKYSGIVIVGLHAGRLHDADAYEHFESYHRFIERMIEAVPINRLAHNAISRTLPGVVNALLLNWARARPWGSKITSSVRSLSKVLDEPGVEDLLVQKVIQAYGFDRARRLQAFHAREVQEAEERTVEESKRLLAYLHRPHARYARSRIATAMQGMWGQGPLTSLREIEEQITVMPATHEDREVLRALDGSGNTYAGASA